MFDPNATSIIFVSGQWHTEFHIQPCLAPFRVAGYKVIPCPLLCVGVKNTETTFQEEVANIFSKIELEASKDQNVCMIVHSAAGTPCSEAINRFLSTSTDSRRLVQLVYVASFLDRTRTAQVAKENGWMENEAGTFLFRAVGTEVIFFNDMSADDAQPFVDALQPGAIWSGDTGISGEAWKSVRKAYIMCLRDNAIPAELQRLEIAENGFESVELDAGHDPYISQPEKFVATVDQILRSST